MLSLATSCGPTWSNLCLSPGPGPTKVNKTTVQHIAHRYPLDNSRYLRTAVIKQAANKQSVILADQAKYECNCIDGELCFIFSLLRFSHADNELSVNSSCASSLASSGLGSTLRTVTWTPPHSIGTATPSHTEGTPSLTESSESECNVYSLCGVIAHSSCC